MKLATPRWWYMRDRGPAPVSRALLRPIGWLWAAVTVVATASAAPPPTYVVSLFSGSSMCAGNNTVCVSLCSAACAA